MRDLVLKKKNLSFGCIKGYDTIAYGAENDLGMGGKQDLNC